MPIEKILIAKNGKKFYVKDSSKDLHTEFGYIRSADLKSKDGTVLKTNTGKELSIFSASFIDSYRRIRRGPQTVSLKDIGIIVAETGINKKSKIVDAGAGSGALACFLANIVKEVTTYDIREDFLEIVKKNIEFLELKNIEAKNKSIYNGIDEKNIDLITLDLPEPWMAINAAEKALKHGGFIISFSPSIPQTMDFVNEINKSPNFVCLKIIELIEREWELEERKVRPKSRMIGHTGFLTFVRKI